MTGTPKSALFCTVIVGMALIASIIAAGQSTGQAESKGPRREIEQLAWLSGSWISEDEHGVSEEQWMKPRAGTMIGMNRTIAKTPKDAGGIERTTFFEFLRIEETKDGLVYFASPRGRQPATPFKMKERGERTIVFENAEHDFPQRIIYRLEGEMMHARIEGTQNGKAASEEWMWRRPPN